MADLTEDELNILVTAVASLVNTRALCKVYPDPFQPEKTKYRILCSDGTHRKLSRRELIGLLEKLTILSGNVLTDDAKRILRGAGVW